MGTKMTVAGSIRLVIFLCTLMLLPLNLFAEDETGDKRVALFPLWGGEENFVRQFGEELYMAVSALDGFQPVVIDLADISPDIPWWGFPPFVSPHPSLIRDMPLAITGGIFFDPGSGRRQMRLYLWQASDYRPLFSDEMVATDRELVGMFLPIMLRWLFSWIPDPEAEAEEAPRIVDAPAPPQPPIILEGQQVVVYRHGDMHVPNRWMYFGLRTGGNVQIFDPQLHSQTIFGDVDLLDFYLRNVGLAAHLHFQLLNFRLDPRILFLGLQFEGIAMHDFNNDTFSLTLPALLRFTARRGTSSFSLLGGAYMFMSLPPFLGDDPKITFPDDGIGPFAGWGYTAGFGMGNRVGPGNFFVEMRLSNDMFTSRMEWGDFRRSTVSVSVGYEFGFLNRR